MTTDKDVPVLDFGQHFAVLNLDWMSILMDAVQDTDEGMAMCQSCIRWNDAVHQQKPRPLTIFSTLAFNRGKPEADANTPFDQLIAPFGDFETGSVDVQIDPRFTIDEEDVILHKTRLSATTGDSLEQILKAQRIDTVIISGLTLSGVVMSTIYRLFDLDYHIYVIADNVIELPVDQTRMFSTVLLDQLIPKMKLNVISLDQALSALERSHQS
ncbi:cysteine hydrolase family protein [Penicillium malachiteum]|nr:cysteine hydrolase family protein [Penicillium malachiteum]